MKNLIHITKISLVMIACFIITVMSCKNNDIDNSPEVISQEIVKDNDFQSFKASINVIRPVFMRNFLKAKSNDDMQMYALKISKVLLENNSETEIIELSKIALLNERQIEIFKYHLVNIKKRRLTLRDRFGEKITKEAIQKAYEVKFSQSTRTADDCSLCPSGDCNHCSGGPDSGGSTTITNGDGNTGGGGCRDQAGYNRCSQRIAEDYAIELATWTLLVILTEGVSAPAAFIALAAAQVKAQVGLSRCRADFCPS